MSVDKLMRMGELANEAKVTPRTVRYYESLGLIPVGLSLEEVGSVIHLYFDDPTEKRAKVRVLAMLHRHLADTETQRASLNQFRGELRGHIKRFEKWLKS